MIALVYIIACTWFCAAFERLDVLGHTRRLLAVFTEASRVMGDRVLTDDEKEVLVRRAALGSLKDTILLSARLLLVLAAGALPVMIAEATGLIAYDAFTAFSLNPMVLIFTVLFVLGLASLKRVRGRA